MPSVMDNALETVRKEYDRLLMELRAETDNGLAAQRTIRELRKQLDDARAEIQHLKAQRDFSRPITPRPGPGPQLPITQPWLPPTQPRPLPRPMTPYPVETSPIKPHWMHETGDSTKRPRGEFRHTDEEEG